jgi:hypothetical protein
MTCALSRFPHPPRPTGTPTLAAMMEWYEAGASLQAVARLLHRHETTVVRLFRAHGVEIRPQGRKPGGPWYSWWNQREELAADYRNGVPSAVIRSKYQISNRTLYKLLSDMGVPRKCPAISQFLMGRARVAHRRPVQPAKELGADFFTALEEDSQRQNGLAASCDRRCEACGGRVRAGIDHSCGRVA